MTNKEIAGKFKLLSNISSLLGESPFKTRSYDFAYQNLRNHEQNLCELHHDEILEIRGIGKNIADKIIELCTTGTMEAIEKRTSQLPEGLIELLSIKGLGPKKILSLWKESDITNLVELRYACLENRLIELKGFGKKTQDKVLENIDFLMKSKNHRLYASLEDSVETILNANNSDKLKMDVVGEYRRKAPIITRLEFALHGNIAELKLPPNVQSTEDISEFLLDDSLEIKIYHTKSTDDFDKLLISLTATINKTWCNGDSNISSEKQLFESNGFASTYPELYDLDKALCINLIGSNKLIVTEDIKGLVHCHSKYSDGASSIKDMSNAAKDFGLEYMVITDHSKSAFYANGLSFDRILDQSEEIDELNADCTDFRIFKGIESDILNDGSLDYSNDQLEHFDLVIASVHSNLSMTAEKATERILNAIHSPYTDVLGHPTGRLLLGRKGYPLDLELIIRTCAENHVAIEINANPVRLDLDWKWIPLCIELGVPLLICPDAHNIRGISHIKYGINAARKGALTPKNCLNTMSVDQFISSIKQRRQKRLDIINNI